MLFTRPVNGTGRAWAWVVQSRPENRTGLLGVAQSRPEIERAYIKSRPVRTRAGTGRAWVYPVSKHTLAIKGPYRLYLK